MKNKKIIFKVTARYMKKNRMRTIITFLGILVMVILMTAVFVGKDTIMEFLKRAVEADQGKWHIQVYDVDKEVADEIAALDYVDQVGISRPLGYTEFDRSGNPEATPFLEIKGYSKELYDWMNIELLEGHFPENENEIMISDRAIREGSDIKPGDSIEIETFERYIYAYYKGNEEEYTKQGEEVGEIVFFNGLHVPHGQKVKLPDHYSYLVPNEDFDVIHEATGLKKTVTVSGIMKAPYYEAAGQAGYIALVGTAETVAEGERVNLVLTMDLDTKARGYEDIVKIIDAHRTEEERAAAEESGSYCISSEGEYIAIEPGRVVENSMLLTFAAKGNDENFNTLMIFAQVFFIVLITAAALILIYNVFSISYTERSRYLGMISSVGATKKQKKWSVYFEVFSLLIVALPLGILSGLLLIKGAMALLYPHFASLIEMIAENVVAGKSCEIPCELIVNPLNILFIALFSIAAVWLSAWIPALKISKTGPIESIRGTDSVKTKRKKGFKTLFRFMNKGRTTQLLAAASVSRNRYTTKGIVRSITAFIVLTLVTAFSVRGITDVLKSKAERSELIPGEAFNRYQYGFSVDDAELYAAGVQEIMGSEETEGYKELNYSAFAYYIRLEDYTEEYRETLRTVIGKFFPQGIPADIVGYYLEPEFTRDNPEVNLLILSDEDCEKLAKRAGIDMTKLENPVFAYDTLELSTDAFRFGGDSVKPDYSMYKLNKALDKKAGDKLTLLDQEYIEETEEMIEKEISVDFAGYLDEEDVAEFATFHGRDLWLIVPEKTAAYLGSFLEEEGTGIGIRSMLFNVNSNDSDLVRRLSQIKDEFGNSAIYSAQLLSSFTDFKNAITSIVSIVAVCFTILIALICLLNLYNSVMGRRYARQRELAVLNSMGITKLQKAGMLTLENIRLLARAFVYSALITTAFVVCLHRILDSWFGKMNFTLPLWMIALTVFISCAGLGLFTLAGYGRKRKTELIDDVRTEMV